MSIFLNYGITKSMPDLATKDFDLVIDGANDDFLIESDFKIVLQNRLIEEFDMSPGDDIDFPSVFSRQREGLNSDNDSDLLRRIRDAKRILAAQDEIDKDRIEVSVLDGKIITEWKLQNDT